LDYGSHPEVELRAPDIGWAGRADLITISKDVLEIADYKTGARHDGHLDQLQTYALLWFRDGDLNPTSALVNRLVLRYPDRDVHVNPPDRAELGNLETSLEKRTREARAELAKRPPEARPARDSCSGCPVRQLCSEYWTYLAQNGTQTRPIGDGVTFSDVELRVIQRNGIRSWQAVVMRSDSIKAQTPVLLRTASEALTFPTGRRVRVIDAAIADDEEAHLTTVTQTSNSGVFQVTT
jgi:hypothetical protein